MPSEKLGVARSGRRVCARGAMPTKKKGGPICQLVALIPEQLNNLHALHHKRYKGDEAITCGACLLTLEAHIKGEADLAIATEGHEKSPTTCLQAFWRVCCNINTMNKNGNLGRKAAKLTVEDIRAGEQALSRASTAPGTPGTPSYNPGEGEDEYEEDPDTQEVGSSAKTAKQLASAAPAKAAPRAAVEVGDGDEMIMDEYPKPKEKRGRGRPKGSKNKVDPKIKARYKKAIRGMKVVPRDQLELIASIPDGQIRLVYLWFVVEMCLWFAIMVRLCANTFNLQETAP